jgi:trimeric autotransporter adhesin
VPGAFPDQLLVRAGGDLDGLGDDERAYWAVQSGDTVVLSNAGQDLRARFSPDGAVIGTDGGRVGLRLAGYGGARLRAVGAAVHRAQANRVVYQHGGIQEWYDNGPLGLEQGFTIAARPAGNTAGQLTLTLVLSGDARGSLSAAGDSVTFGLPGGSLAYQGLAAADGRGRRARPAAARPP